ncbi:MULTISPECIES: universal stress protein [unclassified Modicisalibacter]|uniref:universal stress protein n=1 Tax=unclassified Modicisalibacter TaxID=2679913 RepID=UPI001CCEE62B|nr:MULTISPECIES: universal stress protein [unclassified Modicisalibacter]MBZ9559848.1 universal stress protein [Modicisalibacter sp. R2A 31.J]MBZ9577300.1 universal stress protein [Modicisalibacter sp. MOD 31.J]
MYQKIVLPVDMNEPASWERALPTALALCRTFGASLHVVTVLPDYHMPLVGSFFPKDFSDKARRALSEAQHRFVAEHVPDDVSTQCIVAEGSPYEGIVESARSIGADLIVMASHNRRKLADLLIGPNAEHVVHHAGISVMVVR